MSLKILSAEEREALAVAAEEAYVEGATTASRVDAFLAKLRSGEQGQAAWAEVALRDCVERGAAAQFKAIIKARRQVAYVAHDGSVLNTTAMLGVRRLNDEGKTYSTQELFHVMTWEELRAKRSEYLTQIRAYNGNVAVMDRLLALIDLSPGAATPEDACDQLGTTVEAWLGTETRAAA